MLCNIAIPIIHHKYRDGFAATRAGGFHMMALVCPSGVIHNRKKMLWLAPPRGTPRGVFDNFSPVPVPVPVTFLCSVNIPLLCIRGWREEWNEKSVRNFKTNFFEKNLKDMRYSWYEYVQICLVHQEKIVCWTKGAKNYVCLWCL